MDTVDRSYYGLEKKVRKSFFFLSDFGFSEIDSSATHVCYQNDNIEVEIYHGRRSYEIGLNIIVSEVRYSLSEIIQIDNPEASKQFRYSIMTTQDGVIKAVDELSSLMKYYGSAVLRGDMQFINMLEKQRQQWSKDYALDVLAEQLRPKANGAFQQRDYSRAADLYSRIHKCLSTAELKKLKFAIKHSKST